ncbi:MAG: glycosyltransferase [Lachnospiraceae bacterium]|nr:glycosyltransferase [Lachnospiraceae bacterium]
MKLLFYRYNNICEPDILETFREFGYEVIEYKEEMTRKDIKPSEIVSAVSGLLQKEPVDFVFSINFYPALSEVCNLFRIRYISWTVDSPVPELYHPAIRNEWNRTFIFDREDFREVSAICEDSIRPHVFYLPLAAKIRPKEELFFNTPAEVHENYRHEISFVGSLYSEKTRYRKIREHLPEMTKGYLDGIMRAQERIYGYFFMEETLTEEILREFRDSVPGFFSFGEGTGHFWDDLKTVSRYYLSPEIAAMERTDLIRTLSERLPARMSAYGTDSGLLADSDTGRQGKDELSKWAPCLYTASDTASLPKVRNMGTCKTLTEMPLVFHNSRINLNITSKGIRSGLPLRIFDILSCGGFVLTNFQSELPELFTIGEDLTAYASSEELIDLAAYYLTHEAERTAVAERGYERVKAEHTYERRLATMLEAAFL